MFRSPRISIIALMLLCLGLGCSKSTRNQACKYDDPLQRIGSSPMENEEAELIALCLSGELVAPDGLYEQVMTDLAAIRTAFAETLGTAGQIEFRTPWSTGVLMLGFDDSTVQQIRDGEYHAWDDLNDQLQATNVDTSHLDFIGCAVIVFNGRLHPYRLAEIYSQLPGLENTSPSFIRGDSPNVYSREIQGGMTYLFRNGWGDCPSGCISNEFWYFSCEGPEPEFVGYWPAYEGVPPPHWWEEAWLNREQYCD